MRACVCVSRSCVNLPRLLGSWPTTFRRIVPVFLLTFNPQPIYTIASATYRHHMRSSVIHPNSGGCLGCMNSTMSRSNVSHAPRLWPASLDWFHLSIEQLQLQLSSPRNWLAEEGGNIAVVYYWSPNWRRKMIVYLEAAPWDCKIMKIVIIMIIVITKTTSKWTQSADLQLWKSIRR